MNAKNKAIAKKVTPLGNLNCAQTIKIATAPKNKKIIELPATSLTNISWKSKKFSYVILISTPPPFKYCEDIT